MKDHLLLDLVRNFGLLSKVGTLQPVSVLFITPVHSSFCCERYLWVHSWQLLYLKCIFQCSSRWNYCCLVLWYDQIHRRIEKFFSWLHFYVSLIILTNTSSPNVTHIPLPKKCLDAHRLKKVCLNVLLNHAISLELNVYRFRPVDLLFFFK